MAVAARARMTVDEFLTLPEEKPYKELIAGEVVEKSMPNSLHSTSVGRLLQMFWNHLDESREGQADTELRHADRADDWVYLPDVSVTLAGRRPRDRRKEGRGPVEVVPDFAIEVLSPDDRPGRVTQRVDFYLRAGTQLVWLVDPEDETITVFEPGKPSRILAAGDTADAQPVLRAFRLDVGAFFARVREDAEPE